MLAAFMSAESTLFPRRLRLAVPTSAELSERFDQVRKWAADLRQAAVPNVPEAAAAYRIVFREFRHRVLGLNAIPDEVWIDTLDQALALIGRQKDAKRFSALLQSTHERQPLLTPWLAKRPLNALAMVNDWPRLLNVVAWLQAHPRPGIYLRQVDIPGVDSKFLELHRGVLAELLDLALPADEIDSSVNGASLFCQRYGFRDKPLRIRFRLLDPRLAILPIQTDHDISVTQAAFAGMKWAVQRVFITENEINFLAFPQLPGSMVVFGAGYGFEVLTEARWLQDISIYYWGDIDTHGFAILDQLRTQLPHAQSFLMDSQTLIAHTLHWGAEPKPLLRDLPRLTATEALLFNELRDNRLGTSIRLEQERIGFGWLQRALEALPEVAS